MLLLSDFDEISNEARSPPKLFNNCMKIFESLLYNNVNSFITCNDILPDCQYGFRTGIITSQQLIDLIYAITTAFDNKALICVDAIFFDYSNAFDTVSQIANHWNYW